MNKVRIKESDNIINLSLSNDDDSNNISNDFIAYADEKYAIEFDIDTVFEPTGLKNVKMTIGNNEYTDFKIRKRVLTFDNSSCPFENYIGYVNIKIEFEYIYVKYMYYSEYFGIAALDDVKTAGTTEMLQYVVDKRMKYARDESKDKRNTVDKLKLVGQIVETYSESMGWFKSHASSKITKVEQMVDADKISRVSAKTVQSMIKYPQNLMRTESRGLNYKGNTYTARKAVCDNMIEVNNDTYENRVVLSFLVWVERDLIDEVNAIKEQMKEEKEKLKEDGSINAKYKKSIRDGYKVTTEYIDSTRKKLNNEIIKKYKELINRLNSLILLYKNILNCKIIDREVFVKLTNTFRDGAYINIYKYINIWINGQINKDSDIVYKYKEYLTGVTNTDIARIYEEYAFYEFNRYIARKFVGYRCYMDYIEYKIGDSGLGRDRVFNNHITYKRGTKQVEIYFEPIIDVNDTFNIGLKRNNNYRNKDTDDSRIFYTPDYVIKIKNKDKTQYIICDAKFCTCKSEESGELLYRVGFKYGVGCSCTSESDEKVGVYIVRGIGAEENENIMLDGNTAYGIVPVNIDMEDNMKQIDKIFNECLKKDECSNVIGA